MNKSSLIGHVIQLLEHTDNETLPPDRVAAAFFRSKKYLGPSERRFISNTVFGIIRHRKYIRTLFKQFIDNHPEAIALEGPHIRYLALLTIYMSTFDVEFQIPPLYWKAHFPNIDLEYFKNWIIKNQTLDSLASDNISYLSTKYSFQEWMVKKWIQQVGDEIEQLLIKLNQPAATILRVNTRKITREECQSLLRTEGIETEKTIISPAGLITNKRFNFRAFKTFKEGLLEVQDEGSQLISLIVGPKAGDVIIDACAGAGGKSLHMADLMNNEGKIYSIDVNTERLRELESRAKRSRVNIIETIFRNNLEPKTLIERADIVLVDAPCSGVGTIRRNPGLKWSVTESLVQHYSNLQKEILSFNSSFVKHGGKLVYATCSIFEEENENVVENFLKTHPNFSSVDSTNYFCGIDLKGNRKSITLYPHKYNTDGFFIAIMKRD
jgi:16S rRNA (cytosine967-C5)-methyltransferase